MLAQYGDIAEGLSGGENSLGAGQQSRQTSDEAAGEAPPTVAANRVRLLPRAPFGSASRARPGSFALRDQDPIRRSHPTEKQLAKGGRRVSEVHKPQLPERRDPQSSADPVRGGCCRQGTRTPAKRDDSGMRRLQSPHPQARWPFGRLDPQHPRKLVPILKLPSTLLLPPNLTSSPVLPPSAGQIHPDFHQEAAEPAPLPATGLHPRCRGAPASPGSREWTRAVLAPSGSGRLSETRAHAEAMGKWSVQTTHEAGEPRNPGN